MLIGVKSMKDNILGVIVALLLIVGCSEYGDMDIPSKNKEAYGKCLLSLDSSDIECINKYEEQYYGKD